ncbi:hypothetical protein LBMAG52_04950 [Planctomycetia bacterium]|nr:hypothetical protein LBMAG52_04950 [Planctomycetia bacterium]
MTARRFEFVEGSSSKFWEISTGGNNLTVRYGRIGTNGQTQTKSFTNPDTAAQYAEKQVASKLAKGYRELAAV